MVLASYALPQCSNAARRRLISPWSGVKVLAC